MEKGTAELVEAPPWGTIGAWLDESNERDANIDFILQAVNSHYELVESLQVCLARLQRLTYSQGVMNGDEDREIEAAREALAKATGREVPQPTY